MRILFVEDDPLVRHGLAQALSLAGNDVRACITMAEALQAARSFDPELALLDIGLPDGDGIECARHLRERGFEGALVLLTASNEEQHLDGAIAQGAHTFLVKPVTAAQLVPALRAALASSRSAQVKEQALIAALRDSREISAAVGALAERDHCTTQVAFEQIRRRARSGGMRVTEVAAEILAGIGGLGNGPPKA